MSKNIGAIYYTDLRPSPNILKICQEQIRRSWDGDIVSVSLNKPISFGNKNLVLENRNRSYPTMVDQIIMALEASTADYVFFLEHDVLYGSSHFKFEPKRDDTYYYNVNNWRWRYPTDVAITYEWLASLSQLCCNRELSLAHFKLRMQKAREQNLDINRSREPRWARRWGYEPATKRKSNGGFSDEPFEYWQSEFPNVDIRHKNTLSRDKTTLSDFIHPPTTWKEINIQDIPGWNLKELFNLNN
jgi:hypothetical protein